MTSETANIKEAIENGRRLLDLCRELKKWTEINALLNKRSNINLKNCKGRSPLHYAAEKASLDLIAKLIELGAKVDSPEDENGYTPLHYAVTSGKTSAIKLLLEAGANVNAKSFNGTTPLHLAARSGPINVVKYLISKGADVNARENVSHFTPLHTAAHNNSDEILEVLIKKGESNVNTATDKGLTPLHVASMVGGIQSVRRLIDNGANVHCRLNESRLTPLHLASMNGFTEARGLTKYTKKNYFLASILDEIIPYQELEDKDFESIVKILIEHGSDLQAKDISGATSLHIAARYQSKVLKTLLKYDAEIIAQDNEGGLPFHEAMEHGVGLDWLLRYGADINDINESYAERLEFIMKKIRFKYDFLEHFIKLMAAELPIADIYKPYIEENYLKGYLNECLKEVKKMKSHEIEEGMTFYDLLHTTIMPQSTFKLPHNVESKFPKYHGILRACCHAPLKRRELLDSARLAWYHITNINLPATCMEIIFSNLRTSDLRIIVSGARNMPALESSE